VSRRLRPQFPGCCFAILFELLFFRSWVIKGGFGLTPKFSFFECEHKLVPAGKLGVFRAVLYQKHEQCSQDEEIKGLGRLVHV
jgi:hypothetical protein